MKTLRQRLAAILSEEPATARDLAARLGLREKEVYSHLSHTARSVKARGGAFEVEPARCAACGFVFETRKRLSRPGRCPDCRSERIEDPVFHVRGDPLG
ncbi:MAG: transcriptional regulator [Desulfatibacillaceae bacterium]